MKFKRALCSLLATSCILGSAVTAFASESDFDGEIYIVDHQEELALGETYLFELENIKSNGRSYDVDSDYSREYRMDVEVTEGDYYVDANLIKKSGIYVLEIEVDKSMRGADETVSLHFQVEEKKGDKAEWVSDTYEFKLLADEDNVNEYITEDDEEWDIPADERYVVEVDGNIRDAILNFDDYVYAELRYPDEKVYAFHMDDGYYDSGFLDVVSDNADLEFINFQTATDFGRAMTVRIVPQIDGVEYLYEIDGEDVRFVCQKNSDDEFEFKTEKLGMYVMISEKIGSSSLGDSVSTGSDGTVSRTDLTKLFKNTPQWGTAVLFIDDEDTMKVEDLKYVTTMYPNRALTVVKRINGKTIYQYRMTAAQVANITGDVIHLGVEMGASDTTALFKKYFVPDIYVLGHNNVVSTGATGYYAVDFSGIDLDRDNLRLYWYDETRNYYDPIYSSVWFDQYDYGYFYAPVGYDIVISDGPLVSK